MSNLALVKSEPFGNVQCDFYREGKEFWMSRRQVGEALEYEDSNQAIKNIHLRHKSRLDRFSRVVRIETPSGKQQSTIYSTKGIYEICRWSEQPKANDFYDWVYEMLEGLRTGTLHLVSGKTPEQHQLELDTRARNARVRQGNFMLKVADKFKSYLSKESVQCLVADATEIVLGKQIIEKPKIDDGLISKTDLAKRLGTNAITLGKFIAKLQDDKGNPINNNSRYGLSVLDKKAHCDGQVPVFKFNVVGAKIITEYWETK